MLAIVIPAYNPDSALPDYCRALRSQCSHPIVLVNDGSRPECLPIFSDCASIPNTTVLTHPINRGKGRGLKTAFEYLLQTYPDLTGCLTADADGQHTPADVARCLDAFSHNPTALVLGCRTFTGPGVPFRSRFGNLSIRILFRLVTGRPFTDTQTGLRVLPTEFMRALLSVPGERFDFETRMLLAIGSRPLVQVPIETVYLNGNQSSHFNPLRDSIRITSIVLSAPQCRTFALFTLISILSWVIDIGAYSFFLHEIFVEGIPHNHAASTVCARIISCTFNFLANRHLFFSQSGKAAPWAINRYILLAIPLCIASWFLTRCAKVTWPGVRIVEILKMTVDLTLFLVSFAVQKLFVFRTSKKTP